MDEDPEKVADIKAKIQHGRYEIDPVAVADALLQRLHELAGARARRSGALPEQGPNRQFRVDARSPTTVRLRP